MLTHAAAEVAVKDNPKATFVLNFTHMIGLFTYAFVVGIVAEEVQSTVEALGAGKTKIVEQGHTLVLNSNRTSPHLLRQVRPSHYRTCPHFLRQVLHSNRTSSHVLRQVRPACVLQRRHGIANGLPSSVRSPSVCCENVRDGLACF